MSSPKRQKLSQPVQPKPETKPSCPNFGSGPCAKRPGYDLVGSLGEAPLGRSHRSEIGKRRIGDALASTKRILGLPEDYVVGLVPGSDTGAFEMAMWSLLGQRPVDVCYWEAFGKFWAEDISNELKLGAEHGGPGVRVFGAPFGELPDLSQTNPGHDIVFTLNGTTSGVRVNSWDWISDAREGLTICDATSGVFAMPIPWHKVDVLTFSWQKVLGGEGGHGMMVLSPRAVARAESYRPAWPVPKLFRFVAQGKLVAGIFDNSPINTPSMLCVEDYLDALRWVDAVGGLDGLIRLSTANFSALEAFVEATPWLEFLAKDPSTRSMTSVCLLVRDMTPAQVKQMTSLLDKEGAAHDIDSYRDAPPGIRVWCGATVVRSDLEVFLNWLAWAHDEVLQRN